MLSRRMDQLSLLRQSDQSGLQSSEASSSGYQTPHEPLHSSQTISVPEVLGLLQTSPQLLILDTRPLGVFLESHLPRSANISIPSLIFKRFKKSSQAKMTTWDTLAGFVSTPAGKAVWDDVELTSGVDIVVVGLTAADELAKTSRGIMEGLVEKGSVRILHGGWAAVLGSPAAIGELVSGELSETTASDPTAPPKSAPPDNPALSIPSEPPSRVSRRPSLPSLHVDADTYKRKLPSLSIQGNSNSRRPPKLSLNLDKPMRSATLPPEPLRLGNKSSMLSINVGQPNGLASGLPKTPLGSSFQTLCHAQSKLPPSPSSFGDVKRVMEPDEDIIAQSPTARPEGLRPGSAFRGDSLPSAGLLTSRNSMTPFIVSTVLPSFLFLGPEITSQDDIDVLKSLGVKRILNVAVECDDDEGLMLRDEFERYFRVPMRDTVEESGVAKGMKDACELLGEFLNVDPG